MKKPLAIMHLLLTGMFFSTLVFSCNHRFTGNTELDALKNHLFQKTNTGAVLPIYADPPTADYDDIKNGNFSFQLDSIEIVKIEKYRSELEAEIIQRLDSGYTWVYMAAWLKYESAVPKLKDLLISCDKFYGWEGPDYSKIESYLTDDIQYCYQMAYISAIEYITSQPIDMAVTLTTQEYKELKSKSEKCTDVNLDSIEVNCAARWLLEKLKLNP